MVIAIKGVLALDNTNTCRAQNTVGMSVLYAREFHDSFAMYQRQSCRDASACGTRMYAAATTALVHLLSIILYNYPISSLVLIFKHSYNVFAS